jgi:hypothetical protein
VPNLVAVGWAKRDRGLPTTLVDVIGWWKWPETRGCERRETFRIKRVAFDEMHLGEVIARMRSKGATLTPAAWASSAESAAGRVARRKRWTLAHSRDPFTLRREQGVSKAPQN